MALGRRELLILGGGVICSRAIGCGSDTIVLDAVIPAGLSTDVQLNTLNVVSGKHVALGRDSLGIYAMTLVCTHSGCDIAESGGSVTPTLLHCGCHGSEFDGQGKVKLGPATAPLSHLQVTKDASNQLTIHGDTVVASTDRLAV
ncbi:MAG TPA: Rieske (2Fe-2S) protein [Myxococcales bacterium]|nr:Rieske (2Fe-2S) protein [Myxococcales bacterium]